MDALTATLSQLSQKWSYRACTAYRCRSCGELRTRCPHEAAVVLARAMEHFAAIGDRADMLKSWGLAEVGKFTSRILEGEPELVRPDRNYRRRKGEPEQPARRLIVRDARWTQCVARINASVDRSRIKLTSLGGFYRLPSASGQ